jgi:hypothetical protein
MIEALFMNNSMPAAPARDAGRKPGMPPFRQEERVLDPKKAQNIAILLRALNVTREEVSDALLDGERSYNTDCSTAVTNLLPLNKIVGSIFLLAVIPAHDLTSAIPSNCSLVLKIRYSVSKSSVGGVLQSFSSFHLILRFCFQ